MKVELTEMLETIKKRDLMWDIITEYLHKKYNYDGGFSFACAKIEITIFDLEKEDLL